MVFITAGMGGGRHRCCPIIASIAKEQGSLTIAVVTKPFDFEGKKRKQQAEDGLRAAATRGYAHYHSQSAPLAGRRPPHAITRRLSGSGQRVTPGRTGHF